MMWTRVRFDLDLPSAAVVVDVTAEAVSGNWCLVMVCMFMWHVCVGINSLVLDRVTFQKTIKNSFINSILTWFSLFLIVCT